MSNFFSSEQNVLDSRLNPSAEVNAHGHHRVRTHNWLTSPPQVTPCITRAPHILRKSVLGFSGICGPEPVYAADRFLSPLNQTDAQPFGLPFPHVPREPSPGALRLGQPGPLHLSVTEEATLTRLGETLIPHSARTITLPESHSFAEPSALSPSKHVEEAVIFPSCASSFFCSESLLSHRRTCRAEKEVATATCECASLGIRDKDVPVALITENLNGYNQGWSLLDMIAFNGVLIDEKVVICQWVEHGTSYNARGISCSDPVKGKDLKAHLHLKHGITSDSQLYTCLWRKCSGRPMRKSSLERHMKEHHVPVKWACPICEKTFTRKTSLIGHFKGCSGHVHPFVTYTSQTSK